MSLYLCSTPIGNLEDMTFRCINALKNADIIFAEDTRHTIPLLKHFDIDTKVQSYHEYSDKKRHEMVLDLLKEGKEVALCSDAGMPCINDPGTSLVSDAISLGINVVPIPGANAFLTALIASGISTQSFTFKGFFPRKHRDKEAQYLLGATTATGYYESPNRIVDTVDSIATLVPNRQIVVARELTKLHEEFIRGTAKEVLENLNSREKIRGEIVLLVEKDNEIKELSEEEISDLLRELLSEGKSLKDASKELSQKYDIPKNRVYDLGKSL